MIDLKTLNTLRASVHQAVDTMFNEAISDAQQQRVQTETKLRIAPTKVEGPFEYPWPGKTVTGKTVGSFSGGQWYELEGPFGTAKMLLAKGEAEFVHGTRPAYYVFGRKSGPENPRTAGDWAQFVRTDNGEFASIIRNPNAPAQWLKEGMAVPSHYAGGKVARRDALFSFVKNGPTLWYVVQESDVEGMLTHTYYTAHMHKYI